MTLKHKNTSKWAKRIKKRGFDIQDDGTRAAISEQLQQHALLTRKRNSVHDDDDSSDDSMEEDDEDISGDEDNASKLKLLEKGKKRTLEVLEEDDDMPKSGLLSLPFMVNFCYFKFNSLYVKFVYFVNNVYHNLLVLVAHGRFVGRRRKERQLMKKLGLL